MQSTYRIYLDGMMIPVNPSKLQIKAGSNTYEYNVIEHGDIILPATPKLRRVSFESFLPQDTARWECREVAYYLEAFERIRTRGVPVDFVVVRMLPGDMPYINTDMQAVLTNFEHSDNAGSYDIDYALELVEYRPFGAVVYAGEAGL